MAYANARNKQLPSNAKLDPKEYRNKGNRAYLEERHSDALGYYEAYARECPTIAEPYSLMGDSLSALGRFKDAISVYTKAIDKIQKPIYNMNVTHEFIALMSHRIYFNRGNAEAAISNHDKAILNYDCALKHGNNLSNNINKNIMFNTGNSQYALFDFDKAFENFKMAAYARARSDIALALGNCKVMTEDFIEALEYYREGIRLDVPESSSAHCKQNSINLSHIINVLDGKDHTISRDRYTITIDIDGECEDVALHFAGNRGNIGNTPSSMVKAPGGEGYDGLPGFTVIVMPKSS